MHFGVIYLCCGVGRWQWLLSLVSLCKLGREPLVLASSNFGLAVPPLPLLRASCPEGQCLFTLITFWKDRSWFRGIPQNQNVLGHLKEKADKLVSELMFLCACLYNLYILEKQSRTEFPRKGGNLLNRWNPPCMEGLTISWPRNE